MLFSLENLVFLIKDSWFSPYVTDPKNMAILLTGGSDEGLGGKTMKMVVNGLGKAFNMPLSEARWPFFLIQ